MHDRSGSVLVTLEFQATVDRTMAARILVYTAMLYQDRLRHSSAKLPPVLPIVVYYGPGAWTADEEVAGLCAAPGASRVPYQPAQRHFVLHVGRYTGPPPEGPNWMAEPVRLARTRDLRAAAVEYYDICARWPESEHHGLVKGLWTWLGRVHFPMYGIELKLPELVNVREAGIMMLQVVDDWSAKLRAEGQTQVMRRQAARKLGPETADRLAEQLEGIPDPEQLGEVSDWILEYESGEELLARVARLCETTAAEDSASPD